MTKARFKTLEGLAIGMLLDAHAITECDSHGYMKDRNDPHAVERAKEAAERERFPGTTKEDRRQAITDALRSVGDTCPDCL